MPDETLLPPECPPDAHKRVMFTITRDRCETCGVIIALSDEEIAARVATATVFEKGDAFNHR